MDWIRVTHCRGFVSFHVNTEISVSVKSGTFLDRATVFF